MRSLLVSMASYGLILWGISTFLPQLGFAITAGEGTSYGVALVVVAIAVWIMDRVVKRILKIVTIPLNMLTLGFASLVVNILLFYILQAVLPMIPGVDVGIDLGSIAQVALLGAVLSGAARFIGFIL